MNALENKSREFILYKVKLPFVSECLELRDLQCYTWSKYTMEIITGNKTFVNFVNILLLALILVGVRMAYGYNIIFRYAILLISVVLTFSIFGHLNKRLKSLFYIVVALSILFWLIDSLLHKYRGTPLQIFASSTLMLIYTTVLMGFLFVIFPIKIHWMKVIMYFFLGYNFFLIVLLGRPVEEVFDSETSSGVGLLSLALAILIPVTYLEYREYRRICVLPYLLLLFISFFVASRAGLGICIVLFLFVIFAGIHSNKSVITRIIMYISIGLVIVAMSYLVISNASDMEGTSKLLEQGSDLSGRELIWANYFFNFDLRDLIIGRDIVGINDGEWQNAHNSWIQLHSNTGLFGVLLMLLIIRVLIFYFKHDLTLALLLLALIVYSSFNYIFFYNLGDRLIYMFIFDFLIRRKETNHNKAQVSLSFV